MKKLIYYAMVVIIAVSCKSEKSNLQSDLEAANLKGKVWKIEKTIHNANAKSCCPAGQKDECKQALYVYNEKGNLVENSTVDDNGKILITTKYVYNRHDVCSEISKYSGNKLVGKEANILQGDKIIAVKVFDEDGANENIQKYEYSGNEIIGGTTLNKAGEVVSSFHNEYLNGQLDSQTEKDGNGDIATITKYKRNSHNDVIESIFTNPKMNTEYKLTFDYEYDDKGNWIKQTQLYNGEIAGIIMRNITYYNG
jgi:hypothetical protein